MILGYFGVQFGLECCFLLIFVENLHSLGEAILAKNHKFFNVFFTPGPPDFGAHKAPQKGSKIVEKCMPIRKNVKNSDF